MTYRAIDLAGKRFGRLLVVRRAPNRGIRVRWSCRCDCGADHEASSAEIRNGATTSCGCYAREVTRARRLSHGDGNGNGAAEYAAWCGMHTRCTNRRRPGFTNYGGRGIKVCERWREYPNFLADMGRRPSPRHSIERIDNDGNYEPGNCTWALRAEQSRNRRSAIRLERNGETRCLAEWCAVLGADYSYVLQRVRAGWPAEEALTMPKGYRRPRGAAKTDLYRPPKRGSRGGRPRYGIQRPRTAAVHVDDVR